MVGGGGWLDGSRCTFPRLDRLWFLSSPFLVTLPTHTPIHPHTYKVGFPTLIRTALFGVLGDDDDDDDERVREGSDDDDPRTAALRRCVQSKSAEDGGDGKALGRMRMTTPLACFRGDRIDRRWAHDEHEQVAAPGGRAGPAVPPVLPDVGREGARRAAQGGVEIVHALRLNPSVCFGPNGTDDVAWERGGR